MTKDQEQELDRASQAAHREERAALPPNTYTFIINGTKETFRGHTLEMQQGLMLVNTWMSEQFKSHRVNAIIGPGWFIRDVPSDKHLSIMPIRERIAKQMGLELPKPRNPFGEGAQ